MGGSEDGALVVDLRAFKAVNVGEDGTAQVGAGTTLGLVALKLNDLGLGLPHGTCRELLCPCVRCALYAHRISQAWVGVGGHTSYGGFGYAGRKYGLLVESVVAFDVVLSNGSVISKLTRAVDKDLFWALKGSAGSFAIVTHFYFRPFKTPAVATTYSYAWDGSLSSGQAAKLFLAWQKFGATAAPPELGIVLSVFKPAKVDIRGTFYGTAQQLERVLHPLFESFPKGFKKDVQQGGWIDSLNYHSGGVPLDSAGSSDSQNDFYVKSLMTPANKPLTPGSVAAFFDYLFKSTTSTNWFCESLKYDESSHSHQLPQSKRSSTEGRVPPSTS